MEGALELVVDGREVTVVGVGPDDAVARLAALVVPARRADGRAGAGITVDGRLVPGTTTLLAAGVGRGSHVAGPDRPVPPLPPRWEVVWHIGPCAGRTEPLGPGTHVVGRWFARPWIVTLTPGVPPTVRPAAAAADTGATGPAPFTVDAAPDRTEAAAPPPTGRGTGPWTVTWNRPPRAAPPPAADPVEPPPPPAAAVEPNRTGAVLPLAVSAVGSALMAVVLGQPLWLLLGAVGLVGAVAGRWQQRRHDRRAAARRAQADLDAVDAFTLAVAARHVAARADAAARPDVVAAVRSARPPAPTLWSHRPGDHDAYVVTVGAGSLAWAPTLAGRADHPAIVGVLAAHDRLVDVPVPIRLGAGVVVGIVGPRRASRALARSLVLQLAVRHGPADLRLLALAASSASPWTSLGWLPHAAHPVEGTPMVAAGDAAVDRLVTSLAGAPGLGGVAGPGGLAAPNDRGPAGPALLVAVVDGAELLGSATATARPLLAGRRGPCAAVVLADRALALPASCTIVLELDPTGRGILRSAGLATAPGPVTAAGVDRGTAAAVGAALARFEDADAVAVSPLPAVVRLTDVLGPGATDAHRLGRAWRDLGLDPPPRAPIAVAADGPVELDLDRDGPHALVAGTTGAGKSELLRTLVAALAVRSRPADLSFVLIDYKGGAAFDACAALPHVVGVVTDLDDALAERALVSLEAEVRRRERLLRAVGASDLPAYRRAAPPEPLARVVVVVDEFAALAAELPGFLPALVDVARRGRSLGVHLVLATQRPGGAVSDDIRANTNLRLALRVQDTADALDVVGDAAAAALPRDRPGRFVVRLGPGERLTAQAAWCTGPAPAPAPAPGAGPALEPATATARLVGTPPTAHPTLGGPTELEQVVAAAQAAFAASGAPPPARPWLPPLPDRLHLPVDDAATVGLVDDPARQRQDPLSVPTDGHLLVVGSAARGAGRVLARVVAATAAAGQALYLVDADGRADLAAFADLDAVGAVVRADEVERLVRLVRVLQGEVAARRAPGSGRPDLVVVIDNLAVARAALDDPASYAVLDAFDTVLTDGAALGVRVVAAVDRTAAVPGRLAAVFPHRWVLPPVDPGDVAGLGAAVPAPTAPPGRVLVLPGGRHAQIALGDVDGDNDGAGDGGPDAPGPATARLVAAVRALGRRPPVRPAPIGVLPERVAAADLPASYAEGSTWHVTLGLGDEARAPVTLRLHDGDHLVVAGPARSGRTEALRLLARAHLEARPSARVVFVPGRRAPSPDDGWERVSPAALAAALSAGAGGPPALVLVDDAEHVDDADGVLAALVAAGDVTVAVAARPDALRSLYGHWTQRVRRARLGVLLRPTGELDGDVLGAVLPRRAGGPLPPGRGYLVRDGVVELVQLALVDDGRGPT